MDRQAPERLSVLIVDAQALVRLGIQQFIAQEYRDPEFGEACTAEEAIPLLEQGNWNLVILDVDLSGKDGFAVLKHCRRCRPDVPVLMMSVNAESWYMYRAMTFGASGYVAKSGGPRDILAAVKALLAGQSHFPKPPAALPSVPHRVRRELSPQEHRIMLALARGRRVSEIAGDLSLSAKTVSTYKQRLMRKLGAKSLADLVRYALESERPDQVE